VTTPLFPLFLDLRGATVLLLGEGEAADRRRATLERAGATIRAATSFTPALLDGCALAIGADAPDPDLQAMFTEAQRRGIPVNVVDRPALSTFTTPATVERLPLQIAIASNGAAPVLARLLRARLETLVDPAYGRLAALAASLKAETRARLPEITRRRRFLEQALAGRPAALMLAGDDAAAEAAYRTALAAAEHAAPTPGLVHFVDPGPGPADLLTLRALRLLGEADIIVHQPDESPSVLDAARRDAPREAHVDATARLLELAHAGRRVVRLSPRPGEVAALREAGVAVDTGALPRTPPGG
jgi:uroporphyrin-III C-methyltransferase / precorrin-2 dehydrogenase / sirohydrochlorin ferrochelatase